MHSKRRTHIRGSTESLGYYQVGLEYLGRTSSWQRVICDCRSAIINLPTQYLQYKLNLTMHLDNNKGGLSPNDLLPIVKQYLGSVLFKNAYQYETITHNHAKYLQFNVDKLPITQDGTSNYKDICIEDLLLGINHNKYLNIQLVRTIQYNHVLVCLTIDHLKPLSNIRNAILVIVFPNKQLATKWAQQNSYLAILRIKNPHKNLHKFSTTLQFVLARPQNIETKTRYKVYKHPQAIKNEANCKFRQKNYEQALLIYETGMGLLFDSLKKRQRAVFYANSSQCLYEMRLFESALCYAQISVTLDRTYVKGLYRKFNCLLELDNKEIPRVISSISMIGTKPEAQEAQIKYTAYMANQNGIYNWTEIFQSPTPVFGQYLLNKVELKKQKGQFYFKTHTKINKFELILVHKPLIYKKSVQQKFGQEYTSLTKQIESYVKYQELFYQKFYSLPYQFLLHGQPLTFKKSNSSEEMEVNQIHTICLRCLQLEKTIENISAQKTQIFGIWQKLYAFKHQCLSNCTYIHIKGALVVFAVRDIEPEQMLSVDFLNWQTTNRKTFMKQKLGKVCQCTFCCFQWQFYQKAATSEIIYQVLVSEKGLMASAEFDKIKLYFMWELIYEKGYKQLQLMKNYLLVLQKYPLWQCIMNCLRYLRTRAKNDLFDLIKTTLKRIFQKYFKINHSEAVNLIKLIL